MLQQSTFDFLAKLDKNNNKAWFDKNRDAYQVAKEDFEEYISAVKDELSKLEPALKEQKTKDLIFRIFRDVRFSKDKTPYKAHFSAYFSKGGRKAEHGGFYLHIQPGKSFFAGGVWMPEPKVLKSLRQEVDYNFKEFKGLINSAAFKKLFKNLEGEQLKTVPQGYSADNPAIEYLKMKSFIVSTPLTDKDILSKTSVTKVGKIASIVQPLVAFVNRAMD